MGIHWLEFDPPEFFSGDDAVPVGAEGRSIVQVMRMDFDEGTNGELRFIEEVGVDVGTQSRSLMFVAPEKEVREANPWFRHEYKVNQEQQMPIKSGYEMVITNLPWTNRLVYNAKFKPPAKDQLHRDKAIGKEFESEKDAISHAESLSFDFWERGKKLTASPSQFKWMNEDLPYLRSASTGQLRVLGVSKDYEKCYKHLFYSEKLLALLDMTEKETIRFSKNQFNSMEEIPLHERVKEMAPDLMDCSIRQALAGPPRDSEKWIGRPVAELAANIYLNHLNKENDKLSGTRKKHSTRYKMLDTSEGGYDEYQFKNWKDAQNYLEEELDDEGFEL